MKNKNFFNLIIFLSLLFVNYTVYSKTFYEYVNSKYKGKEIKISEVTISGNSRSASFEESLGIVTNVTQKINRIIVDVNFPMKGESKSFRLYRFISSYKGKKYFRISLETGIDSFTRQNEILTPLKQESKANIKKPKTGSSLNKYMNKEVKTLDKWGNVSRTGKVIKIEKNRRHADVYLVTFEGNSSRELISFTEKGRKEHGSKKIELLNPTVSKTEMAVKIKKKNDIQYKGDNLREFKEWIPPGYKYSLYEALKDYVNDGKVIIDTYKNTVTFLGEWNITKRIGRRTAILNSFDLNNFFVVEFYVLQKNKQNEIELFFYGWSVPTQSLNQSAIKFFTQRGYLWKGKTITWTLNNIPNFAAATKDKETIHRLISEIYKNKDYSYIK